MKAYRDRCVGDVIQPPPEAPPTRPSSSLLKVKAVVATNTLLLSVRPLPTTGDTATDKHHTPQRHYNSSRVYTSIQQHSPHSTHSVKEDPWCSPVSGSESWRGVSDGQRQGANHSRRIYRTPEPLRPSQRSPTQGTTINTE